MCRTKRVLFFLCGAIAIGSLALIAYGHSQPAIKENGAIHALVYNKPHVLLHIHQIHHYEKLENNITVYAELVDYETVGEHMTFHLREQEETMKAYSYQSFPPLTKGQSYLFEGYIEKKNGETRFIIEHIITL